MIKSYYNNVETNIPLDLIMKFAVHAKSFDTEGMKMATLLGHSEYIGGVSYFHSDEYETLGWFNRYLQNKELLIL